MTTRKNSFVGLKFANFTSFTQKYVEKFFENTGNVLW